MLDTIDNKQRKKIEKFKKQELKRTKKEEKRLEKIEDKEFANKQKLSRIKKYNQIKENDYILQKVYFFSILSLLFLLTSYTIYSLIKRQLPIFHIIIFFFIVTGFLLTSTIQKKKERKLVSIFTSICLILWMLLHL